MLLLIFPILLLIFRILLLIFPMKLLIFPSLLLILPSLLLIPRGKVVALTSNIEKMAGIPPARWDFWGVEL